MPALRSTTIGVLTVWLAAAALASAAQDQKQVVRVQTATATIVDLERPTRGLVYRTAEGVLNAVTVVPEVKIYDELEVGDLIIVDYIEAAVITVSPGARPSTVVETTAAAKSRVTDPLVRLDQQFEITVTIDEVDLDGGTLTYHAADNRRVKRGIVDPRIAESLKVGDVVRVVYTRERAISVTRPPKP